MEGMQPPVPPQVAQQQQGGSPLQNYASASKPMQGAQSQVASAPVDDLLKQQLQQVGQGLQQMAQLLVNQKPQLVPYLKPVVQGLAALASQIEKGGGQQPSMPGGSPEGGANAPSGDSAMGAGAMGM